MSSNSECSAMTGSLIVSFILAILGIAFIYSIVGVVIGLALIVISWIMFIISLILLVKILLTMKDKPTGWCKFNIIFCIILLVLLIAFSVTGGVEHTNQNKPVIPQSSNEETTMPAQPSL